MASAKPVRVDTYLSLFFLPLFPVKRGQEYLECERCGSTWDAKSAPQPTEQTTRAPDQCPRCQRRLEPHFVWCPHCGQKVRAA